jgi:hypothetical protein
MTKSKSELAIVILWVVLALGMLVWSIVVDAFEVGILVFIAMSLILPVALIMSRKSRYDQKDFLEALPKMGSGDKRKLGLFFILLFLPPGLLLIVLVIFAIFDFPAQIEEKVLGYGALVLLFSVVASRIFEYWKRRLIKKVKNQSGNS